MKRIGCAVVLALSCSLALLWVYALCLVNPYLPDYQARKIRMMFRMSDQGQVTVPALVGLTASVLFLLASLIARVLDSLKRKE